MNGPAARDLGFPWRYGDKAIAVQGGQGERKTEHTANHEKIEKAIMDNTGIGYHAAHKAARRFNPRCQGENKLAREAERRRGR